MEEKKEAFHFNRKTVAVILAGGSGSRMGSSVKKQFMELAGCPLIAHTLRVFQEYDEVDEIVLVTSAVSSEEDNRQVQKQNASGARVLSDGAAELSESCHLSEVAYVKKEIVEKYGFSKVKAIVPGGTERYHSVYAGLMACRSGVFGEEALTGLCEKSSEAEPVSAEEPTYVLIHDGARAFITKEVLDHVMKGLEESDACVAAVPVKDTIKKADANHLVTETLNRKELYAMQTPQAFSYPLVMSAYEKLIEEERAGGKESSAQNKALVTDDAMVVEKYHPEQKILLVQGSYDNLKVTTQDDLSYGEFLLMKKSFNGK